MALTETPVCEFNKSAINFTLPDANGKQWSLDSVKGENGLLVMFICNHCSYVKAIIDRLVADCKTLQANGIGCIAIMSNDYKNYQEDSPDKMQEFAEQHNFSFPYIVDETQKTAKDYGAVCTPDFFGFNKDLELQYRGRFDSAMGNEPDSNTKKELLLAMLQVAKTGKGISVQNPSMGCSIKWRN